MLESISFLLNPKQYFDEKLSEIKTSLSEVISTTLVDIKNNKNVNTTVDETLKLLKIKDPRANVAQLDDVLCWMIDNTEDYSTFPVIIKKSNGNIDVNETWGSLSVWIEHLNHGRNKLLMQIAAEEEAIKQAERDQAIKMAEKEVLAKKVAADAALAAAAAAAQQAQAAIEAAEKLKK